jgi:ADP-heptose:LPS heptosyltransferase
MGRQAQLTTRRNMNVKMLQRVDRWVGVPLCFGLSGLRAISGHRARDFSRPPRSLLVVKLAEQGSTVLAYPALRRAVEIVGRQNVYFIVFEDNRFILDALEVVPAENVLTVSVANARTFLVSVLSALWRLRRLRIEAAVDLEFFSRGSAALAYLSGAERRVGFHSFFGAGPYRGDLMTHKLIYNPHLHTSRMFLSLVEALLTDPSGLPAFGVAAPKDLPQPPQFAPSPEEASQIKKMLGPQHHEGSPLIVLNANASDMLPLRRWPLSRYAELARRLLLEFPQAQVVFTGGRGEAPASESLVTEVGSARCISVAGKTTMRQLLVLFTLADALVTNDSGPAHFASLAPVQVVTLFGPETPRLFAAVTPRNRALWAELPCSPCVSAYNNRQSPCRNNLCMQAISVDEVLAAVCLAIEEKARARVTGVAPTKAPK